MRAILIATLAGLIVSAAAAESLMFVPGATNSIPAGTVPGVSLFWNFKGAGGGGGGGGGCASVCLVLRII